MTNQLLESFIVRKLVLDFDANFVTNFVVNSVINFDVDFSMLILHTIWGL